MQFLKKVVGRRIIPKLLFLRLLLISLFMVLKNQVNVLIALSNFGKISGTLVFSVNASNDFLTDDFPRS